MVKRSPAGGEFAEELERIYCLTGCTAVGKTEWALQWAEQNEAEIVNCDSLLFYRGMNIGTAKPTSAELERVPHHLIDICEASQQMDIAEYVERAIEAVREIQSRGRKVLVTGGSGFYLKAFFEPVVDAIEVSDAVKADVSHLMEQGLHVAVARLKEANPAGLGNLDTQNPRRVIKALERCLASGLSLEEAKERFAGESNELVAAEKELVILEREKEELWERIERRVDIMLEDGLVAEVEGLLAAGIESNPSAANAIGYRETIAYLRGEYTLEEMREKIVVNTRRLSKKQRTWFRGQLPVEGRRVDLSGGVKVEVASLFSR